MRAAVARIVFVHVNPDALAHHEAVFAIAVLGAAAAIKAALLRAIIGAGSLVFTGVLWQRIGCAVLIAANRELPVARRAFQDG